MNHIRTQIRTLLDDTFIASGRECSNASDKICMLSQPISMRNIFRFKLFALTGVLLSYVFLTSLVNGWLMTNAWTASALAIMICFNAVSLGLLAYLEKRVGHWELLDTLGQMHANKKHKREWRFVAA